MKNSLFTSFTTNLGLLLFATAAALSGFAVQFGFHMGHHGNVSKTDSVLGMTYSSWSTAHKISIVLLSVFATIHIVLHWSRYVTIVRKRLFARNKTVVALTLLFVLVALTGFVPWAVGLFEGNAETRKFFIEIHDKITLVLFVYLILHTVQKFRWFVVSYEKLTKSASK